MTTRHWGLGATLLAVAIVVVVVLPPRPVPDQCDFAAAVLGFSCRNWYGGTGDYTAKVRRARNRFADAIAARPHGAADVRASRGPLALRSTREPVVVVRDPDVPIDAAREWLRDAEMELAVYPRATSVGVPVIIGLHTARVFPDSERNRNYGAARLLYTEGRDTACIADVVLHLSRVGSQLFPKEFWRLRPGGWDGRRIGRCALYARYGVPGAGVQAWYGLLPRWQWTYDGSLRVELARRATPRRPIDWQQVFFLEWGSYDWPGFLACLNSGVACEGIFNVLKGRDTEQWSYREDKAILIADLLKSRGPDRFVRFWRSSLPVDSALQEGYGVPVGVLGREALLRRVIPRPPAGPHRGAVATSVVWLAGLLGLAMVLSRRQTMGL